MLWSSTVRGTIKRSETKGETFGPSFKYIEVVNYIFSYSKWSGSSRGAEQGANCTPLIGVEAQQPEADSIAKVLESVDSGR